MYAAIGKLSVNIGHCMSPLEIEEQRARVFPEGIPTIINCVGVQATREQGMNLVDSGGTIVIMGLGHGNSSLPVNHLVRQEISFIGSYTYSYSDFQQAVSLLQQGKIDIEGWTQTRSLADGPPAAFQELVRGKSEFSKIFLKP